MGYEHHGEALTAQFHDSLKEAPDLEADILEPMGYACKKTIFQLFIMMSW
jgi:hypothetical protein